jgi:hypothetical protein
MVKKVEETIIEEIVEQIDEPVVGELVEEVVAQESVFEQMVLTPEQIQQQYSATMNSVTLLNDGKPEWMSEEDWADTVSRNKEHIALMLSKTHWTDEDLTPFQDAIL